jgi:hypothetical protein
MFLNKSLDYYTLLIITLHNGAVEYIKFIKNIYKFYIYKIKNFLIF